MTVAEVMSAVVGPVGALALALIVLFVVARVLQLLWGEHMKADQRDRDQRDVAQANNLATKELLRQSLENNAKAIDAWNRRNEQDAARQRRSDNRS